LKPGPRKVPGERKPVITDDDDDDILDILQC